MGKLLKIIMSIIAVVIVLIVIAAIVLPMVIDPNDYKVEISEAVKKNTGRTLDLQGDLDLSVFPWLGIETGKIVMSNAPGFGDKPFAAIDEANIKVKIIPLFSKQVEVSRIVLKGLTLNLAKNNQGVSNWADLVEPSEKEVETAPSKDTADESTATPAIAALTVGGISLEDANVEWDDQETAQYVKINDLNFKMDEVSFDSPIDFEMSFSAITREPQLTERMSLSATLTVNENLDLFTLEGLNLSSDTGGEILSGGVLNTVLSTYKISVNQTTKSYNIEEVSLSMRMEGGPVADKAIETKLKIPAIAIDLNRQTLSLVGLKLSAENLVINADITGEQILDVPKFVGPITLEQFSPRQLMEKLGLDIPSTQDPNVLTKLSAKFDVLASDTSLALNDIVIDFDNTHVTGQTTVKNFSQPAISFNYKLDQIDLDQYLPPPSEKKNDESVATPATAAATASSELPIESLRALNIKGELTIDQLKANGLTLKNIKLTVDGKNGVIQTKQRIGKLYLGQYNGAMRLDARTDKLVASIDEHITNVQIEPLLQDLTGKAAISGTANLNAKLNARGTNPDAFKSTLAGNIDAVFTDGSLNGINIPQLIREAQAKMQGKTIAAADTVQKTDFSEMRMVASVKNGIVNNETFEMKSPLIRIEGNGQANLVKETLNYRVKTKIVKNLEGQGGTELNQLKGIPIPILVTGSFTDLSYQVDIKEAFAELAKTKLGKKVEEKKAKVADKIENKFGKEAGDLFKKLF